MSLAALGITPFADGMAQVQVRTGNCSPKTTVLTDRVACFVKVRDYQDTDGLMDLISPNDYLQMAKEYLARYQLFQATPGTERAAKLATFLHSRFPDAASDSAFARLHDDVFRAVENGAQPRRYVTPIFAAFFLWDVGGFTVRTVETELGAQTDSSAKLYLTQKVLSPSASSRDAERRFVFQWKKELGNWYLALPVP